jgi:hypothetical protein
MKLAQEGKYPVAKNCEIHVGELDWQSSPDNVTALAKLTGWDVTVVKGAGICCLESMWGRCWRGGALVEAACGNIQPEINAAAQADIHSANGVTQGLHVN